MMTFGLNYDVKPQCVKDFIKISQDSLKLMKNLKGHVLTKLYSDVERPNSFLIYSEWETEADFKIFITSNEFREVQNLGRDMLESEPRHKIYETRNFARRDPQSVH